MNQNKIGFLMIKSTGKLFWKKWILGFKSKSLAEFKPDKYLSTLSESRVEEIFEAKRVEIMEVKILIH
jgi:hypothetical protein